MFIKDTINITVECDSDEEREEHKKEFKLTNIRSFFKQIFLSKRAISLVLGTIKWPYPHIEISNPPPELSEVIPY